MVKLILAILFAVLLPASAIADTHVADSCSSAHVQTAIDAAADGDTVTVPAGECTWTSQVAIANKQLTINGNGVDSTIITANITTGTRPGLFKVTTKPATITGFTFNGTPPTYGAFLVFEGVSTCTDDVCVQATDLFRVTSCKFTPTATYSILTWGKSYGLVDANTFTTPNNISFIDLYADTTTSWGRVSSLGTNRAVVIENNTFANTNSAASLSNTRPVTSDGGARFVYRYNTSSNNDIDVHGYCGVAAGSMQYEIYNNSFSLGSGKTLPRWMFIRGGSGVVFNNTMTNSGTFTNGTIDLAEYRLKAIDSCSGAGQSCCSTYPCQDQIGLGTSQASDPLYFWNNKVNGAAATIAVTATVQDAGNVCGEEYPDVADYIQLNRDYFNTTKIGYTAYTCPHPLASASGSCSASVAGTAGYSTSETLYSMTPTVTGEGCTIDPAVATAVAAGETQAFTVTVSSGYHITTLSGCGGALVDTTFTSAIASEDCAISLACRTDKGGVTLGTGGSGTLVALGTAGSGTTCFSAANLTYNANESTSGTIPAAQTYCPGMTATASANSGTLARTGYTYDGWNTAVDGSGTSYTAGSGTFTIAGDTTLYAKWAENPYPHDVTGVLAWYSASDIEGLSNSDPVAEWTELAGGGSFTQSEASLKPLYKTNVQNGKPALLFDASNDFMVKGAVSGIRTVIVVGNWNNGGFPGGFNVMAGMVTGSDSTSFWLAGAGSNSKKFYTSWVGQHIYVDGVENADFCADFATPWHVVVAVQNSAEDVTNVYIGKSGSAGTYFWNGYIAEIIFLDHVLEGDELATFATYLKTKYGTQ